ncbi:hypothetical protein LJCM5343_01830 [Lactobacillus paragasseri]|jgi:hypothetical protein|uniref:Uncharacterized protein n=1 Tax=Lactobacillus paragasseri TaxID=2107999 RepID=A0ABQ0N2K4_9LACO|nr:hypothetical protein LpgJCM5343_11390 [Lactobacillus paragasseri]GBA81201.1 hypothetical protein LJCM1130_07610 [Lactobacillus paragasseri]GBA84669.1 hypothetical protein LJCM5343_01830 [Lactobacillus paragasseri]
MSSFNDYIKFSLNIEDQNIVFSDYFKNVDCKIKLNTLEK